MGLCITRFKGESFLISGHPEGEIVVTFVEVRSGRVTLDIKAPESVFIQRDDMKSRPNLFDAQVDEREVARKIKDTSSHPCRKCGMPSDDLGGLCFSCDQKEQGD